MATIDHIRGASRRAIVALVLVTASVLVGASTASAHPGVPGAHDEPEGVAHWLSSAHHLLVALAVAVIVIGVAVTMRRALTRSANAPTRVVEVRER
jgi:hypothetical protein